MDTNLSLSQEIHHLHANLCSALGDPTRILILYLLAGNPLTVNELTGKLGILQPTTSRQLKVLRERGLVRGNRQGQNVEYTLSDRRIIDALDTLRAVLRDTLSHRATLLSE